MFYRDIDDDDQQNIQPQQPQASGLSLPPPTFATRAPPTAAMPFQAPAAPVAPDTSQPSGAMQGSVQVQNLPAPLTLVDPVTGAMYVIPPKPTTSFLSHSERYV